MQHHQRWKFGVRTNDWEWFQGKVFRFKFWLNGWSQMNEWMNSWRKEERAEAKNFTTGKQRENQRTVIQEAVPRNAQVMKRGQKWRVRTGHWVGQKDWEMQWQFWFGWTGRCKLRGCHAEQRDWGARSCPGADLRLLRFTGTGASVAVVVVIGSFLRLSSVTLKGIQVISLKIIYGKIPSALLIFWSRKIGWDPTELGTSFPTCVWYAWMKFCLYC